MSLVYLYEVSYTKVFWILIHILKFVNFKYPYLLKLQIFLAVKLEKSIVNIPLIKLNFVV